MPSLEEAREQALEAEIEGASFVQAPAHRVYALVRIWWKAGWSARGHYDEQRIAALVAALEEERGKFQRETLRTSELTALLLRVEKLHSDRGHEPGAWSRGCPDCVLVAEARALIATPINLRALADQTEE